MDHKIEHIARAFYDAEDGAQAWDHEAEILKEEFRRYAREAIAMWAQMSGEDPDDMDEVKLSYAA